MSSNWNKMATALNDRVYLDYAATTPVDPRVVEAMAPYWSEVFGNSASIHSYGRDAAKNLEAARAQVADVLGCHPSEIIFTANGTESNNLAVRGAAWAARNAQRGNHIITTTIEHHAVSQTVEHLRDAFGFEATFVPVDEHALVDPRAVENAIRDDTILISVMLANNEVGTVQPVDEIGKIAHDRDILFHSDAVQAAGKLGFSVADIGVDLLAVSAHKFYGPKGVGAVFVRRGTAMVPPFTGGGHELGQRPGTVNVAGNVGLAAALSLADKERESENQRLVKLRDQLIEGVLETIPDVRPTGHPTQRLADSASFVIRDCDGESLLMALDLEGIGASTGSACAIGDPEPSFVLSAMGFKPDWAMGSLRLTLGRWSTARDIDRTLAVLPRAVEKIRALPAGFGDAG
jgi:cysteine desulfurase